ncbi:hypothetical protein HYU14_04110 [Candidatus Woesearchaeota archaeon]|nr:hypothetical protein [Candidatus Woesearchaeota archaeon]
MPNIPIRNKKMEWKDFCWLRAFFIISTLTLIPFLAYITFLSPNSNPIDFVGGIIFIGLSIFMLFNCIRTKLTIVYKNGLRIGNTPDDRYQHFSLKTKSALLKWNEISTIMIVGGTVPRFAGRDAADFLVVKDKYGNAYKTLLCRPKSFLKILRELKRGYLLSKDSKYFVN